MSTAPGLKPMHHSHPIRVYYEDTDAGGVVYHANYLKFAERARTELLRVLGFGNKALAENAGFIFVVRHINADYFKTAHLDDLLDVKTNASHIKNSSFILKQRVVRDESLIFSADVTLVCVDKNTYKPVRLPDDLRQGFSTYLKESE